MTAPDPPPRPLRPDSRHEMIERNMGLVFALARPYRDRGVSLADLVQEGAVGLIRAVDGFDPGRGVKFSTYAAWWIRRSLRDAIGAERTIRIPPGAARQLATVLRAEAELRAALGSVPTAQSVAGATGLSLTTVRALRDAARVAASLDQAGAEDPVPLGETLADPDGIDPFRQLVAKDTPREVLALVLALSERHRQVVVRRYGVGGAPVQSSGEIGALLGIKEERTRQLEREALKRLRELAAASGLAP